MTFSVSWGILLLAGLCCLVPGSLAEDPQKDDAPEMRASHHDQGAWEDPACRKISHNITDFTFDLYKELADLSKTSNILVAPTSVAMDFAMLSLGTKADTRTEILEGLNFNLTETPEPKIHECFQQFLQAFGRPNSQLQLTTGSSLFINKSVKLADTFLEDIKKLYHSEPSPINFRDTEEAKEQMNNYVEKRIARKIVDLFKQLKKETSLALVDYLSFHGKWRDKFMAERVMLEGFHVDDKTMVRVPMINRLGRFDVHRDKELSSWVLAQHYVGNATAFFILPDPKKMRHLEEKLTYSHFEHIQRAIDLSAQDRDSSTITRSDRTKKEQMGFLAKATVERTGEMLRDALIVFPHTRTISLHFPRLLISGTYELKPVLRNLGITKIFSNEADLSGVSQEAPLKLSKAVHVAELRVDEKETEVTGTPYLEEKVWSKYQTVMFNRPFLVIIKDDNTNFPLFMGKVVNPTQK
ncbi:Alpha-1-antitrypsin- protein [Saguinus oedipus]|uniref:Alpha-1-antitrypsin- protein n=1 Tax=Saguinus oedipus TaxID=9490 RepID=A0ABQ9V6U7_SAGOE|nr:Alpha-1-antitrypsin- protein [Saguinus oedipus]